MDAIIYILWISIPIILVLLAIVTAIRNAFDDSKELDRRGPRRILRRANAFAIYAAICAAADLYVLQDFAHWFPDLTLTSDDIFFIRLVMLPALAVMGSFLMLVGRTLRPRRGFDRLQMEVRGSSPIFLFVAFGVVAFVLWDRSEAIRTGSLSFGSATESSSSREPSTPEQSERRETSRSTQTSRSAVDDGQPRPRGLLQSLSENFSEFANEVRGVLGMERTSKSSHIPEVLPTPIPGDRPDFNPEGNLTFGPIVDKIAREEGVDPLLAQALVEVSSGFNLRFEGIEGHTGLMGLRPDLMGSLGDRDFFNGYQNIRFGCRELKKMLESSDGDIKLALARYRVGPDAIASVSDIAAGTFLNEFVEKVLGTYEIAKARNQA